MNDLDIVKLIEQELKVELKELEIINRGSPGYKYDAEGRIKGLDLNSCGIGNLERIGHLLEQLPFLSQLDLGSNAITNITPIQKLTNLKALLLEKNLIEDVTPLQGLYKLNLLWLQNNPIKVLPRWFFEMGMVVSWGVLTSNTGNICLSNNPLQTPPQSVIKQGRDAIVRYFDRLKKEGEKFIYETKLILVGEGGAGKTSLQKRLQNPKVALPKGEERTRGIKIDDWIFKKQKTKQHVAHIWDFGGQDVYFPVHRFFLTENSVFVLLASTRQTHHNFDYWIPTIFQFGGKSPIILGQTCHQGNRISWNDLGYYIAHENFNIIKTQERPYYEINLLKNEGLKEIKEIIIAQLLQLPHYGKGVPASWVQIRKKLAVMAKNEPCISYEEVKKLCKQTNPEAFKNIIDIEDAVNFFHAIGIVLWYKTIEGLNEWVILQPEWAMTAVYKIIDDEEIQKRNGHILADDFKRLWKDNCYDGKHGILKKMLEVFKIAFPKKHTDGGYIIPARLLSMAVENQWPDNQPYLRINYKYDFMPKGLINQLSADLSKHIANDIEVWNNAVNLIYNETSCQIEEDFYKREIIIKAKGRDARALMVLAMEKLNEITSSYKGVRAEIIVPCTCVKCISKPKSTLFGYEDLLRWSNAEEKAKVFCNEGREFLLIDELLFSVGLPNTSKLQHEVFKSENGLKLFVSYSKYDEDYLQDFEDHLVTLKEEGLVTTFNCREIEFGKEWDAEIKQQIEDCDVMVCLISVKFLNTDYIKKIEIGKAIDQGKTIIPIIIKPCDWENSKLGKYQAAQRGKVVALNNNLKLLNKIKSNDDVERAAFWTDIIKEFRKKLFS